MPIQPGVRRVSEFELGVTWLKIYAGGTVFSMKSAPPA